VASFLEQKADLEGEEIQRSAFRRREAFATSLSLSLLDLIDSPPPPRVQWSDASPFLSDTGGPDLHAHVSTSPRLRSQRKPYRASTIALYFPVTEQLVPLYCFRNS
jgi:hypothetical protein